MILITGATGHFGKAAAEYLLKKTSPSQIAVLVREPAKAADLKSKGIEVRQGDYDNYESLVKAFTGVDTLLFVSSSDVKHRLEQQRNVVKAAQEAKIKRVVYTSFQRKNETASSPIAFVAKAHLDTENHLKESGLNYTILKNTLYADMLPIFIGDKVLETGTIFLPTGDGKTAFATRADMAEAAVNTALGAGHENKIYEISGGSSYTFANIAEIISGISGKKITHVSPTLENFGEVMTKAGVPAEYIGMFSGFGQAIQQGEFDLTDPTLEKLLGRKPTTTKEYLQTIYGK